MSEKRSIIGGSFTNAIHHSKSPSLVQLVCVACAGLFLASCTVSKTLETSATDETQMTGSISGAAKQDGLNAADAETIKSAVVENDVFSSGTNKLAWSNPETGNNGAITAIERTVNTNGKPCKKFETTVASFSGVSIYMGETCEQRKGVWNLSWFMPKDFGL